MILLKEGLYEGPPPPLTAGEALDFGELCELASAVLGATIRHVVVPEEQRRSNLAARGVPTAMIEIGLGLFRASRQNEFAAVAPTLARLLGRPTQGMRQKMATNEDGFN